MRPSSPPRLARTAVLAAAMGIALGAALAFGGCATKAPAPELKTAAQSAAADGAGAASPNAAVSPNAATAAPASAKEAPELSFPYRRASWVDFLVASLHEPELPKKAADADKGAALSAAPKASAPGVASAKAEAAPSSAPKAAASPAPKAAPAAVPKASAAAEAKKAEAKKPAASDAAKDKGKSADPKNAASTAALAVVSVPEPEVKPDIARNFSAVEGLRFEIPFVGTGWTYLGEKTQKEGIAYDSRRFEGTSLVFILNPVKAGDYILRFQRQDSLRGISYEELVGVSVAPKAAGAAQGMQSTTSGAPVAGQAAAGTQLASDAAPVASVQAASTAASANASVPAPGASAASAQAAATQTARPAASASGSVAATGASAPLAAARSSAPASAAASAAALPASAATAPQASSPAGASAPASMLATPEAALAQARSELEAGRPQGALDALDRLMALAPAGTDEAYMLYARALEANGPQKDIKRAYSYYAKLRDDYPESPFWDEAAARAAYIERHYFDIR